MGRLLFPILASLWTIYMVLMWQIDRGFKRGKAEEEIKKAYNILLFVEGVITALYVYNVVANFHVGGVIVPNWTVIGAFSASVLVVFYIVWLNVWKQLIKHQGVSKLSWILTWISAGIMYVHVIVFNVVLPMR